MPAKSKAMQRSAAMALRAKRGQGPQPSGAAKSMMDMSEAQLREFAQTKLANLPQHVKKKT